MKIINFKLTSILFYIVYLIFSGLVAGQKISDFYTPYKPSKEFLQQNPNFLIDSTYTLNNYGELWWRNNKKNFSFNSSENSLKPVQAKREMNKNFKYYLIINKYFEISDSRYEFLEKIANAEDKLNCYAAQEISDISFHISNDFDETEVNPQRVYLLFKNNEYQYIDKFEKHIKKFPSVYQTKLYVLNCIFDTVATYRQSIFANYWTNLKKVKIGKIKSDINHSPYFQKNLQSLLAQFANDDITQSRLISTNNLALYNPKQIQTIETLRKLKLIQQSEAEKYEALKRLGYTIQRNTDNMKAGVKEYQFRNDMSNRLGLIQNNDTTASIITTGLTGLASIWAESSAKNETSKNELKAQNLLNEYKALTKQEDLLLSQLESINYLKKNQLNKESRDINSIYEQTLNSIQNYRTQLNENKEYLNQKVQADLNAISNNTSPVNQSNLVNSGSRDCSVQANVAWKNSKEYKNYQINATNANASDNKAALIELTLQYCRSKLPYNEIQALTKTAIQERTLAKQLRLQTPNFHP